MPFGRLHTAHLRRRAGGDRRGCGLRVLELGTGLACRRLLHVEVWDYSQEWGNLAGLVCPKYTALWFLLGLWVLGMMRFLRGFAAYVARTVGLKHTFLLPCFFVCEDWKSGLSPWMFAIIKP
ncbi:MAG: putative ABC transporter permease [Subdoligranulum sp.]